MKTTVSRIELVFNCYRSLHAEWQDNHTLRQLNKNSTRELWKKKNSQMQALKSGQRTNNWRQLLIEFSTICLPKEVSLCLQYIFVTDRIEIVRKWHSDFLWSRETCVFATKSPSQACGFVYTLSGAAVCFGGTLIVFNKRSLLFYEIDIHNVNTSILTIIILKWMYRSFCI